MTQASSIIQSAYREANLIGVGASPDAAEQTEALARLNSLILGMLGSDIGEMLRDWLVPAPQRTASVAANYPQQPLANNMPQDVWRYPPKNSRIVFGSVTDTVYFPETPDDGSRMAVVQGSGAGCAGADGAVLTLNGNGRLIGTTATATLTAPVTACEWLYRADLGRWLVMTDLALTDELQFPREQDDVFILGLANRLCPRYGKTLSIVQWKLYKDALTQLRTTYRQKGVVTFGADRIGRL
jgi:hypothetical protein